jgi:hypothetical protein
MAIFGKLAEIPPIWQKVEGHLSSMVVIQSKIE